MFSQPCLSETQNTAFPIFLVSSSALPSSSILLASNVRFPITNWKDQGKLGFNFLLLAPCFVLSHSSFLPLPRPEVAGLALMRDLAERQEDTEINFKNLGFIDP